jgi:NAD(P)H dehydrogenase (quinone)
MAKIYIVFYSMYGHVHQMAKAVKEGVDKVPGCQGVLYQVCPHPFHVGRFQSIHALS